MRTPPSATGASPRLAPYTQPRPAVRVVGWLMAAWCIGFAVVNIVLESTDHLADSEYADYAAAFTVMNWIVVGLKLVGAAVALLSVARRPLFLSPRLVGVLVWSIFATLAVYVVGGVAQAVAMLSGLMGSANDVDLAGIGYLIFFLTAATGWGVLAISYSRRHALGRGPTMLGALGAPVVLGLVLVAVPTLLAALGLMPSS